MFVLLWHHLKHTHSHSRSASVQIKLHTCHTFIVWRIWNDDSMEYDHTLYYILTISGGISFCCDNRVLCAIGNG